MTSVLSSVRSLIQMFDGKAQEFIKEIDNVHMVWLEEIQQEANRMFSRDFNAEPELMPKTPSQKKNSRRKRVSLGRQEESQARRFSKGKRSNLRGSAVKSLNLIAEEEAIPEPSTSEASSTTQPKRTTRRNKQKKPEVAHEESQTLSDGSKTEEVQNMEPGLVEEEEVGKNRKANDAEIQPDDTCNSAQSPPKIPCPEIVVNISREERLSAEFKKPEAKPEASPGRTAVKIAIAETRKSSRRSSARCSLKLRHSLAGLRHSMTQESVRRTSRRSMLKRKAARGGNSASSSNIDDESSIEVVDEDDEAVPEAAPVDAVDNDSPEKFKKPSELQLIHNAAVGRITRSVAANSPKLAPPLFFTSEPKVSTPVKRTAVGGKQQMSQAVRRSHRSSKRKSADTVEDSPTKKKSRSAIKPNMRSFHHTVQKNQMLMMTPNSLGRTAVIKSFIKHTTPLKVDPKINAGIVTKERQKLEALKKKQEQEEERMRKMEEEKKRKQEELKRKRDERIKRVFEAKFKEEQREEEKKKKLEQKMAQIEKNDKRLAEEKTKKKLALKKQEELEMKKKMEEEAKKRKQEEEKRQQELAAKKKAEEEEQARKEQELKREQERQKERERQAAAERERLEKEKALALQRELERAAKEKEMRELEEKRKALEERSKLEEQQRLAKENAAKEREEAKKREAANKATAAGLNVTVDIERSVMSTPVGKGGGLNVTVDITQSSPQSYAITPTGSNKPLITAKNSEDYGMDQNSDDSTDDESAPRKPIPSWAEGSNLKQHIMKQYFNPPDLHSFFGTIEAPKLENIFYKSKPRYFKRTSSAVWHSPPGAK